MLVNMHFITPRSGKADGGTTNRAVIAASQIVMVPRKQFSAAFNNALGNFISTLHEVGTYDIDHQVLLLNT